MMLFLGSRDMNTGAVWRSKKPGMGDYPSAKEVIFESERYIYNRYPRGN